MREITVPRRGTDLVELLAGRRRELFLVASVLLVLLVSVLLLRRPAAAVIAPPSRATVSSAGPAVDAAAAPSLFVHVAGYVHRPGLYELPQGARVADAIEAAGGPTRRGDLDALNLAQVLTDGYKIEVVGRMRATAQTPVAEPSAAAGPISLNAADQALLETIPGIGPVTATSILNYREANGGFTSLAELLQVDGIGPATLDSIAPYLTL